MSEQRDASFRAVVRQALGDMGDDFSTAPEFTSKLGRAILARLHERGLAIHDTQWCRRVPWQDRTPDAARSTNEPLGRPMTVEEQIAVGLVTPGDPP